MNEEWDIHSSQRPSIRQFIDLAKREHDAAMQALEPDPNADLLTQLDQQWAKESMKYTGPQRSQFGIPVKQEPRPFMLMGFTLVFSAITSIFVVFKAYCVGFFFLPFIILMLFGVRNQFRFAKAQKAYLAKRAQLIAQLGLSPEQVPLAPVVEKPLVHRTPLLSAASQIRQLQNHYYGIQDQEQYRRSVKSIIAHAPEHERDYLRALAAIESEWVQARLKYVRLDRETKRLKIPRGQPIAKSILGIVIAAFIGGLALLQSAPLITILFCVGFIALIIIVSIRDNQRAKQYYELEQYYTEQRNQVNYRFRDRTPF
ncbi:hypothetical protein [Herpetosiphon gulosus]|uniref:DNA mismatch repair protein MutS n=1 Tax=Herpetosiphon gulosus TaxID=1973496 RepID=A0ABP9X1E5_9CHLR